MSVYPAVEAVRLEAIQDRGGAPEIVCEVYELGSHRRTPAAVSRRGRAKSWATAG